MDQIHDIENKRQQEQIRLDQHKNSKDRNQLGQFATPPDLALEIAEYAWRLWKGRQEKVRFLDPGIGTGSFYAALRQVFPKDRIEYAAGVEIDPLFSQAAKSLWKKTGLKVTQGDFLALKPPSADRRYNLVLTNPPYVRHHHLGPEEKKRLQGAVARYLRIKISGLAGLYCYFLLLSDLWLAENGLAAWLIPSEFMDVNYGSAVKEYLTKHVSLIQVHRFSPSDVQFTDALVTSAIVFFQKTRPSGRRSTKLSYGGSLLSPTIQEYVPLSTLGTPGQKWTNHPTLTRKATDNYRSSVTLGDIFTVKRGIATGANDFFIIPRDEARENGIPNEFLRPILPSPRKLRETTIESDDQGYPRIDQPLTLIDCPLTEEKIRKIHPEFWSYLKKGKEQEIHKRYLPTRRSPWYSQEKRPPAPFLCTYMGRNKNKPFRFFWNKSKATAANVYLLLYPKGPLEKVLEDDSELYGSVFKILQSITAEKFLNEGRVYGGGLFKMEPKELARLSAELLLKSIGTIKVSRQRRLSFA